MWSLLFYGGDFMSSYEEKILKILKLYGVKFEREKSFSDLRGGKFRYDFYIPNYHGRRLVIEVQGEQHYVQNGKFHKSRIDFTHGQENDRRKISYALSNGMDIYVIPYWVVENLKSVDDIFCDTFMARDRWKNDYDWRAHKNGMY